MYNLKLQIQTEVWHFLYLELHLYCVGLLMVTLRICTSIIFLLIVVIIEGAVSRIVARQFGHAGQTKKHNRTRAKKSLEHMLSLQQIVT